MTINISEIKAWTKNRLTRYVHGNQRRKELETTLALIETLEEMAHELACYRVTMGNYQLESPGVSDSDILLEYGITRGDGE